MSIIANFDINIRASSQAIERAAHRAAQSINKIGAAFAVLGSMGANVLDVAGKILAIRVSSYFTEIAMKRLTLALAYFAKAGLNVFGRFVPVFKELGLALKNLAMETAIAGIKKLSSTISSLVVPAIKKLQSGITTLSTAAKAKLLSLVGSVKKLALAIPGVGAAASVIGKIGGFAGRSARLLLSALAPALGVAKIAVAALGATLTVATGGLNLLLGALAAVGAAGAAAFGGMVIGSREGSHEIEELSKTARDIGVNVDKLAGLHHAADLARVDLGTLDETLVSMQRRLEAAATQTSETALALSQLGVSVASLENLTPDEKFLSIAESLSQVGDETERARLAVAALGESGSKLLPMFARGSAGIKEAMAEATALGLTVSNAEAKEVQAANDAMNSLKKSFLGLFRTAAVALAPIVKMIADAFTSAMKWIISFRDKLIEFLYTTKFVWDHLPEVASAVFSHLTTAITNAALLAGVRIMRKVKQKAEELNDSIVGWLVRAAIPGLHAIGTAVKYSDVLIGRHINTLELMLQERIESERAALSALIGRHKQAIAEGRATARRNGNPPAGLNPALTDSGFSRTTGAVERGSQAAFALTARTSGDKMFKAENERLAAMRARNKQLEKLAQRWGVVH